MRTTTLLMSVTAVVAATLAAAAPAGAAAAAPPPLVYTTYHRADDGTLAESLNSVGYDATARRRLLAVTSTNDGGVRGPEITGPAASYSPDHTRLAWMQANWTGTSVDYAVEVMTVATKAVTAHPLPAGDVPGDGGSYPTWSPDGRRLVLSLGSGSTSGSSSTLSTLDTDAGTFAPLYALPHAYQVSSIAVSADGSIAFTSDTGVSVLVGGTSPVRSIHRTGTDEYCTAVRARPGATREFTYLCSTYSSTHGLQVLTSQTPYGTARTVYSADITPSTTAPVTFLDGFAWAPSGASLALVTTTVRTVDSDSCTNAMTTALRTVTANGTGRTTLKTEPTITAQTCRGTTWGDVDDVVWSADGKTIVFLHATTFLGPMTAYAVRPAAPQTQTVLAQAVIDLSS